MPQVFGYSLPSLPVIPGKWQWYAYIWLILAVLYYIQASRLKMNPSISTALQWPLWLFRAPTGTINVFLGAGGASE